MNVLDHPTHTQLNTRQLDAVTRHRAVMNGWNPTLRLALLYVTLAFCFWVTGWSAFSVVR